MDVFKFNLILRQCERDNKAFETLFDFYYPRIKLHIHKKFPDACADDVAHLCLTSLEHIYANAKSKNLTQAI